MHRISRVALDSHARHVVERDGTGRVVDGSIHGTWAPGAALKALGRALAPVAPSNVPIESITAIMALLPGDVIATGTPAGIGPLLPGDRVTVRVEGIGELTNPVVA